MLTRRLKPFTSIPYFGSARRRPTSYFLGLHDLFELLANNPLMGQEAPDLGDGIRRFLYEAHIVFYRPMSDGVLILDLKGVRQR